MPKLRLSGCIVSNRRDFEAALRIRLDGNATEIAYTLVRLAAEDIRAARENPTNNIEVCFVDGALLDAPGIVSGLAANADFGPVIVLSEAGLPFDRSVMIEAGASAVIDFAAIGDPTSLALVAALARSEARRKREVDGYRRNLLEAYDSRDRIETQSANMVAMAEDLERAYRVADTASRDAAETAKRLESVINTVVDSVLIVRADGKIEQANPAAERIFGSGRDKLIGSNVETLLPGIELHRDEAEGSSKPRRRSVFEWQARNENGQIFPVELTVGSLRTAETTLDICVARDITDRKRTEERIRELALTDPLTKLSNRNAFVARLRDAIEHAERDAKTVALILMDLNKFKAVNDNFGHPTGDALLIEVARHLRAITRRSDTVARLGGDEFAIILSGLDGTEHVPQLLGRVIEAVCEPMIIDGSLIKVGTSLGVAFYPTDDIDVEGLIRKSDLALYQAKATGQNAFRIYDKPLHREIRQRKTLEDELRLALARDEFEIYVQPQIDVAGPIVTGVEALVRWRHPTRGLLSPAEFLHAAETAGLIGQIDHWVLNRACLAIVDWDKAGLRDFRMAVNISIQHFKNPRLLEDVGRCLNDHGIDPSRIEFEITETAVDRNLDPVVEKLMELRALGVGLAIDDFGTGYASLAYLRRFPLQRLKIDRSFAKGIVANRTNAVFVRAIVGLARDLGLGIVVEGIETAPDLEFFRAIGCNEMQGFHFSKPMPLAEFANFAASRERPTKKIRLSRMRS